MRNRKNKKKNVKTTKSKDRRAEIVVYVIIILLTLSGLLSAYLMSKEFEGFERSENGHFKKVEKGK